MSEVAITNLGTDTALGLGTEIVVTDLGGSVAAVQNVLGLAIPASTSGALLAATGTLGVAQPLSLGANLSLSGTTLSATGSALTVVAGAGLAGGTITSTGTISLAPIAAGALMGNPGGSPAVPGGVAVGAGLSLSAGGTLSSTGILSLVAGTGISVAGSTISNAGVVALVAGTNIAVTGGNTIALAGTLTGETLSAPTITGAATNAGTLSGGTVGPATLIGGTTATGITTGTTTDSSGNPVVTDTVGGTTTAQIGYRLTVKTAYVQLADSGQTAPNAGGAEAIDLQLDRNTASQAATGNRAFALGAQNTVTGTRAGALGYSNTASGQGSLALGQSSNDHGANATIVFAGGNTGQGVVNAQLSGTTSAGGSTRLTSDGSAAGAHNVLNIANNTVASGRLVITGRNPSDGTGCMWDIDLLYWAASSAITVQQPGTAAISPTFTGSSMSTATVTVTGDSTNLGINVTAQSPTGVSGHYSASFIGQQQT
jgi:hypothetical protein